MIVKTVSKKTQGTSNFGSLAAYMLDEKNAGRKVEDYRFTNCSFDQDNHNLAEIQNTQALNTRSKSDKTYHMVVSFQAGENPTPEILEEIENELVKAIGMERHQRLSVIHGNTGNLHIHIAINKVDPMTYRNVDPSFDKTKLQEKAAQLEKQFGLMIDNHTPNKEKMPRELGEIHSGIESFKSWVKSEAVQQLTETLARPEAKWEDLHKALGEYDLEIRQRGNGFVIAARDGKLFCKASDVSRDLSKAKLESKFGAFEKPAEIIEAKTRFGERSALMKEYWTEYREQSNENRSKKPVLLTELKRKSTQEKSTILSEYKKARGEIQAADYLNGKEKREKYSELADKKRKDLNVLYQKTQKQRNEIYAQIRHVSFKDHLIHKAIEGDTNALKLLRSMKPDQVEIPKDANVFIGKEGKPVIRTEYKPIITQSGDVIYKLGNRTRIMDQGNTIRITELRKESEYVQALMLAREKFGKSLDIQGSDEFKKQITAATIKYNLDVEFKDRSMEDARLAVSKVIDHAKEQEIEKSKSKRMGL
ncbi:MAG: TraI/MobA(P) family conjugative relaxase [Campylobacterota bacterium]